MSRPASTFIIRIIAPARKAAMEPTERSMPPAMITKVPPTAMMPMKADRVSTLKRLVCDRNAGCSIEPITSRNTSPSRGSAAARARERVARASGPRCALSARHRTTSGRFGMGVGSRRRPVA
jgi:hypothetical protein